MDARPVRILVVDDSALYRQTIQNVLRDLPDISVVGIARNGSEALQKIEQLDPDLLTLDVQMPDLNGIEVLQEIKRQGLRAKALMVSSFTAEGAQVTTDALMEGAFDFLLKPSGGNPAENRQRLQEELEHKLTVFRQALQDQHRRTSRRRPPFSTPPSADTLDTGPTYQPLSEGSPVGPACSAVLIGISTGGPAALRAVLPKLPAEFPVPVIVVQHMPAQYTTSLARRLDETCELPVLEATDGLEVRPGTVLIAPGGRQMKLIQNHSAEGTSRRTQGTVQVQICDDPPENGCRPAVDYLLRSAADVFAGGVLAVIMTGMGRDGLKGCQLLKQGGCTVFAQDADTCVVYGMPKAVIEEGLADRVLPLGKIAPAIVRHVKRSRRS